MIRAFCRKISDLTAAPIALVLAIVVQMVWMVVGTLTGKDPFPFTFLLTVSNIIQLVLIFVIAVAQKDQGDEHDARHESLHERFDHILEVLHGGNQSTKSPGDLPPG